MFWVSFALDTVYTKESFSLVLNHTNNKVMVSYLVHQSEVWYFSFAAVDRGGETELASRSVLPHLNPSVSLR